MMQRRRFSSRRFAGFITVAVGMAVASIFIASPVRAAACVAPSVDYGSATATVNAPAAGTYRVWSRIMAPSTINNTYMLQVDTTCFTVGGSAVPVNAWTWVDYQTSNAKTDMALTQGVHNLKFIGTQSGVKLDRVIIASDLQCVPAGNGDNCNIPADATPPTVEITAPRAGTSVRGSTVAVAANATDNTGVTKVEFYINGNLAATDTTSPYSMVWDSTKEQSGTQVLIAKAYDAAGNISSDNVTVTAMNDGDTQPPSIPTGLTANAVAYNDIRLSWKASTDNVGIKGYIVNRNGAAITQVGAVTSYTDTSAAPGTGYTYQLVAVDTSDNRSAATSPITVQTPPLVTPDTSAPTVPGGLSAVTASSQQINLAWSPSSDNIGVTGYEVYRSSGGGSAQKVATVTTTTYGDTGLQANTAYTYFVKARDAAGNTSDQSNTVSATTFVKKRKGRVTGRVTSRSGQAIAQASVTVSVEGVKYSATTNSKGAYEIREVPRGRYTVTFKAAGYKSKSVSTVVNDGSTTIINARLIRK